MACLSQASHLGSLLLPHDAFQEHAAHRTEWSAQLSSKGSERTCIRSGLPTFLHCACTAHPDFVVDGAPQRVRAAHVVISRCSTPWGRHINHKIAPTISRAWHFTTKSGGVWEKLGSLPPWRQMHSR